MTTKELLDARWKLICFALLAPLVAGMNVVSYQLAKNQHLLQGPLTNFNAFIWRQWFEVNAPFILALGAVILGCGLIAGEVSKGTILFLLSKPVSRERILLTKYAVSMGILFAVVFLASFVIEGVSIVLGHSQDVRSLLVATVLLWLGASFPLGLSLLFSVVFPDIVRPLAFALVILVVLLLPTIFPNGQNWSLLSYWSSSAAYLGGGFPLKEYLVCFLTALVPLLAALVVFRRKAY